MKYINLENIDIVELYNVFLKVFGDYKLEFTMSLEQFKSLLKRGCYSSKYSFGMIDDEKIVGIMLNGYKNKYGIKESYGIAAGIIPEYRNKGGSALAFMNSCFKKLRN